MKDMIQEIKNKIVELMPISKGNYSSQFVVKYDKDNMLRIMFKYECLGNHILDFNEGTDKSIQQYFLDEIHNITKTNPDKSTKNMSYIMRKKVDEDGEFDIAGLSVLNLTYNVSLSNRVTRPSMRTLLGLE